MICVHSNNDFNDILLIDAIKSLENQTYKNFKVLIVFDECWERTKIKILNQEFNLDIETLDRNKKEGLSFAKNFGLKHITSEWVGFLDADDLYMSDKLLKQVEYIKKNDIDFLGTLAFNRIGRNNNYYDSCFKINQYVSHNDIKNVIFKENVLTHGSMLIKKSCLDDLKGYNNVKGMEDWDLWKRAIEKGYKFYQLQDRLYVYTIGTSVAR